MLINYQIRITIAIAIGTLISVTALAATSETNYMQVAIYGKDPPVSEKDQIKEDDNDDERGDHSDNDDSPESSESLDTNRDNVGREPRDLGSSQSEQQGVNDDSVTGNVDTNKKTLLQKGITDIEKFLPPNKMASGDIVNVPAGDSSDSTIIVRSDPIYPESYIICAPDQLEYECVSHPYPDTNHSSD